LIVADDKHAVCVKFSGLSVLTTFGLVLYSAVPMGDQERRQENTKQVVILYPHRTLTPFNWPASSGKPRKEQNRNTSHEDDYCEHVWKRCCPGCAT